MCSLLLNTFEKRKKMELTDVYLSVMADYPDVLTVKDLCSVLNISTKAAYRLMREQKIQHIKIGRSYRIPKAFLLTYLKLI